jgi:hypothetical protein
VAKPPHDAEPRRRPEPLCPRRNRADRDNVIGIGGVAKAQEESQAQDRQRLHG